MHSVHHSESTPSAFPTATVTPAADRLDVQTVRAWARSRGYPIDESGSIPLAVLRTYRRLHPC